jgi:maltooligosyltrehalose synthase
LAFARPHKKDWVLIVVPRWLARARYPVNLDGSDSFWGNTTVGIQEAAPVSWRNILTGETFETHGPATKQSLHVGSLLRNFPVALLSGTTSSKRARKAQ